MNASPEGLSDVSTAPYWLDGLEAPSEPQGSLPRAVDVAIIGAGYTGLSAACETALAGRSTLVLDAGGFGAGCSGRNGGQVAYSFKPSLEEFERRHGRERAMAIGREGFAAMEHLRNLAEDEHLAFDWRLSGYFYGAHTARHFRQLQREAGHQPAGLEQRISVVSKADQGKEIDTPFYHGGLIYHDDASLHPAKLLLALQRRALDAGAQVRRNCEVRALQRQGAGFELQTARGLLRARRVLIATNGYSGPLSPWHRRRVIPIGSYQIATEELGEARVRALLPTLRNVGDTRRVVVYFRPSVDGRRIVFGGRAALAERNALAVVPRMRAMLAQIFPGLSTVHITHCWVGMVAFTFDTMLHIGQHDGLFHCLGYCGQGVPTAPYFGMRIGQQMVGNPRGATPLDGLIFPARPYHFGEPWFLAPSVLVYRTLDFLGI
ncbi:MAG: FAD-binding oxidoreductase [Proteobacteria bacterium]|nr:FAD-binding oxidoreductase [Pseudomonadota bacterium]